MCEVLGVSTSGYYSWRKRTPFKHAKRDAELSDMIVEVHEFSCGTYCAPRIQKKLKEDGHKVSRKRIARLMKCESFVATFECELLDRRRFQNHKEARAEIFSFIEDWNNPRRRHSAPNINHR